MKTILEAQMKEGQRMEKQSPFTVADLSLRDCWKIVKSGLQYWITLGIIYGIGFVISYIGIWGYEAGSDTIGFEPM
jgi:hypothetical protein